MARGAGVVLETDRLLLRPWRVAEAAIRRELWLERDPRVPPHRRLDASGRPTLADLDWARSSGNEQLWASVWDWNTASRRVLAKLGFTEVDRQETPHGTNLVTTRQL